MEHVDDFCLVSHISDFLKVWHLDLFHLPVDPLRLVVKQMLPKKKTFPVGHDQPDRSINLQLVSHLNTRKLDVSENRETAPNHPF